MEARGWVGLMRIRLPSIPFAIRPQLLQVAHQSRALVRLVKALPLPDRIEWLGLFVVLAAGAAEWFGLPELDLDGDSDEAPDLAAVGPKTGKDAGRG